MRKAALPALVFSLTCLQGLAAQFDAGRPLGDQSRHSFVIGQAPLTTHAGDPSGKTAPATAEIPWSPLADRSRIILYPPAVGIESCADLTPDFAAAGRPDVSFDGRRILFVGKKRSTDVMSVWEMTVKRREVREVVRLADDCHRAIYLSTLYVLDAPAPEYRVAVEAAGPRPYSRSIFTCRLDGSDLRQITYAPFGAFEPCMLSDGRLLFSMGTAAETTGDSAQRLAPGRGTSLFTVYPDGTDLFPFAGFDDPRQIRHSLSQTSDGHVVLVASQGADDGRLIEVPRTRSLHVQHPLSDGSDGCYQSPSPLSGGKLLVSFRPRNSAAQSRADTFGVYVFDPKSKSRGDKVFDDPVWDDIDAVALEPRREPAGRSTVVDPAGRVAQLYCMNAYLSDRAEAAATAPGQIARVRVIEAMAARFASSGGAVDGDAPAVAGRSIEEREVALGEAAVDEDGSFFLELPAATPLRLETLDREGKVLSGMQTWMWMMPGERRGCIGCHEDRELTPPNRHVIALRKPPQRIGVGGMGHVHHDSETEEESDPER